MPGVSNNAHEHDSLAAQAVAKISCSGDGLKKHLATLEPVSFRVNYGNSLADSTTPLPAPVVSIEGPCLTGIHVAGQDLSANIKACSAHEFEVSYAAVLPGKYKVLVDALTTSKSFNVLVTSRVAMSGTGVEGGTAVPGGEVQFVVDTGLGKGGHRDAIKLNVYPRGQSKGEPIGVDIKDMDNGCYVASYKLKDDAQLRAYEVHATVLGEAQGVRWPVFMKPNAKLKRRGRQVKNAQKAATAMKENVPPTPSPPQERRNSRPSRDRKPSTEERFIPAPIRKMHARKNRKKRQQMRRAHTMKEPKRSGGKKKQQQQAKNAPKATQPNDSAPTRSATLPKPLLRAVSEGSVLEVDDKPTPPKAAAERIGVAAAADEAPQRGTAATNISPPVQQLEVSQASAATPKAGSEQQQQPPLVSIIPPPPVSSPVRGVHRDDAPPNCCSPEPSTVHLSAKGFTTPKATTPVRPEIYSPLPSGSGESATKAECPTAKSLDALLSASAEEESETAKVGEQERSVSATEAEASEKSSAESSVKEGSVTETQKAAAPQPQATGSPSQNATSESKITRKGSLSERNENTRSESAVASDSVDKAIQKTSAKSESAPRKEKEPQFSRAKSSEFEGLPAGFLLRKKRRRRQRSESEDSDVSATSERERECDVTVAAARVQVQEEGDREVLLQQKRREENEGAKGVDAKKKFEEATSAKQDSSSRVDGAGAVAAPVSTPGADAAAMSTAELDAAAVKIQATYKSFVAQREYKKVRDADREYQALLSGGGFGDFDDEATSSPTVSFDQLQAPVAANADSDPMPVSPSLSRTITDVFANAVAESDADAEANSPTEQQKSDLESALSAAFVKERSASTESQASATVTLTAEPSTPLSADSRSLVCEMHEPNLSITRTPQSTPVFTPSPGVPPPTFVTQASADDILRAAPLVLPVDTPTPTGTPTPTTPQEEDGHPVAEDLDNKSTASVSQCESVRNDEEVTTQYTALAPACPVEAYVASAKPETSKENASGLSKDASQMDTLLPESNQRRESSQSLATFCSDTGSVVYNENNESAASVVDKELSRVEINKSDPSVLNVDEDEEGVEDSATVDLTDSTMAAFLARHRLRSSPATVVNRVESPIYQLDYHVANATKPARAVAAIVDPSFWSTNATKPAAVVAARDAALCTYTALSRATRTPATTTSSKAETENPPILIVEKVEESVPEVAAEVEKSVPEVAAEVEKSVTEVAAEVEESVSTAEAEKHPSTPIAEEVEESVSAETEKQPPTPIAKMAEEVEESVSGVSDARSPVVVAVSPACEQTTIAHGDASPDMSSEQQTRSSEEVANHASVSTTEAPVSVPEEPVPTTEAPISLSEELVPAAEALTFSEATISHSEEQISPAADSKAPISAPEAPVSATEVPVSLPEEPVPVTEEPAPVTEAPVPATEEPVSLFEEPTSAAEEPVPVTEAPISPSEEPVSSDATISHSPSEEQVSSAADSKAQISLTEESVPVSEEQVPVTEKLDSVSEAPVSTSQEPVPVSEAPVPVTEDPVPVSETPAPVSEEHLSTSEETPVSTSEEPVPVSEAPVSVTEEPISVSEAPVSTTEAPAPVPVSTLETPAAVASPRSPVEKEVPIPTVPKQQPPPTPTAIDADLDDDYFDESPDEQPRRGVPCCRFL